jgi:hypothetical protein
MRGLGNAGSDRRSAPPMCEKCDEIDRKMSHYRRSRSAVTDPLAVELLKMVIQDFQYEKDGLHPDEAGPSD